MSALARPLRELCGHVGIATGFRDALGARRSAPVESLLAVLRARGVAIERPEHAARWLSELERRHWTSATDGSVVSWGGARPTVALRLPARLVAKPIRVTVTHEDGAVEVHEVGSAARAIRGERRVGRVRHVELALSLGSRAPRAAPVHGLHRLAIESGAGHHELAWIAAPRRAHAIGRGRFGLFAPLHALRTRTSLGVGDFDDLGALVDAVGRLGGDCVAILPVLAAFLDEPFEPSPYSPVSRLHWSELYLDVESVPEGEGLRDAALRLGTAAAAREAQAAIAAPTIDHRRVMQLKRGLLEACARRLFTEGGPRRDEFEQFLRAAPSVVDYARFRATAERLGTPWRRWPAAQRDGRIAQAGLEDERVRYHAYVQWLVREQLGAVAERARSTGLGLMLDYPVGVHRDGFDTWRHRSCFLKDCSLGAPPDDFFRRGQGWGLAGLDPAALARREGLEYVRAAFANHMRFAGVLRIDHVMGLTRTFVIPSGASPVDGVYVAMPRDALHALVCLESARHSCAVLGEDLGTVPAGVREAMGRHGLLRMHVLELELRGGAKNPLPRSIPADSVASFGSHDTATFAGYLGSRDVDERAGLGLLDDVEAASARRERSTVVRRLAVALGLTGRADPARLRDRCWRWLADSRAALVLASLEDLWLESEPHNVPGTGPERANWVRRDAHSVEDVLENAHWMTTLARVARARRESRS